ncbi:hypothetical protein Tco_0499705 [Tanacetum coccineum]
MLTEKELTLEQTQQGVSYEVSNIRVILFTVKMEILLETTSNKLMVDPHGFEEKDQIDKLLERKKVNETPHASIYLPEDSLFLTYQIPSFEYRIIIASLNGMFDSLFDIYQNVEYGKELWDSLEAKYMAEDASSKKFHVSDFTNYKMTDLRTVMEQYNELLGILSRFTQHKMNMDEAIQVSCIIDKLHPSWKDFKNTFKYKNEELTLVELGSHLRIEESLRV